MKYWIGIDNGTSGSIGVVSDDATFKATYTKQFIKMEQSYTKKKQNISRIEHSELYEFIKSLKDQGEIFIALERPMVNSSRFKASMSGIRAIESTLIIIERLEVPYMYIDSKEWQKAMLPSGNKGPELKVASASVGLRLFPHCKDFIKKQKDADGLLIAEYVKRKGY